MKTKTQISFAVTPKLISAFVFATWLVQFLYFLNTKFQAFSYLLWLHSPVCVGPGRKPRRPVFSQRGSNKLSLSFSFLDLLFFHLRTPDLFPKATKQSHDKKIICLLLMPLNLPRWMSSCNFLCCTLSRYESRHEKTCIRKQRCRSAAR